MHNMMMILKLLDQERILTYKLKIMKESMRLIKLI